MSVTRSKQSLEEVNCVETSNSSQRKWQHLWPQCAPAFGKCMDNCRHKIKSSWRKIDFFFFLPSRLCLPGNVAGSNLLEALSKAMKHLAAAVSIRMPLQFSFNQLAAVLREMGLQRHLCPRSSDTQPLAGTDALLSDRLQQDVWLGWAGRALAAPGAHTWGSRSK